MSTTTETTPATEDTASAGYTPSVDTLGTVLAPGQRPKRPSPLSASLTFGWRSVLKIKHVPEQLFDVTVFPLIMTLMFTYLFGGAIAGSTGEYIQFLLPGILSISIVMITMYAGIAVNTDISKGVFDRFRTLPIWRPAVMVGYLLSDALRYLLAAVVIIGVGLLMGYRPAGGTGGVLAGVGLVVVFSFAFSWIWTMCGLLMRSEKAVMGFSNLVLFPLTFLSNTFVETTTMPGWLQAFVKINPISHLVSSVRSVMDGRPDAGEITWVLVATAVLLVGFGSATMWLYNRK